MNDERFEELREGIFQELLKANQHFKVFWGLYYAPEKIASIMNDYITYFFYTMIAHHDCFCIRICNVTNHNRQTGNIPSLLNHITNNEAFQGFYTIDEINDMWGRLNAHKDLIKRLRIARDKHIAHNQLLESISGIRVNHERKEGEILLNDFYDIFNTLSRRYDANEYSLDIEPNLNMEKMLSDLNEYQQIKKVR